MHVRIPVKERFRRWLIRKLGGFYILPGSKDVLIKTSNVRPREIECVAEFSQKMLQEVSADQLEWRSREKLNELILKKIISNHAIAYETVQEDVCGDLRIYARLYYIDSDEMKKAKGEKK